MDYELMRPKSDTFPLDSVSTLKGTGFWHGITSYIPFAFVYLYIYMYLHEYM